jgi:hypothetical protein
MDSTRKILIQEVNERLGWLVQYEAEKIIDENDTALNLIELPILQILVDHWYTCREKEIFTNDKGIEIDEHLNVEEFYIYNK